MTKTIPNEETGKRRLAISLERIRRAEGFPSKGRRMSLGQKPSIWIRPGKFGQQVTKQ